MRTSGFFHRDGMNAHVDKGKTRRSTKKSVADDLLQGEKYTNKQKRKECIPVASSTCRHTFFLFNGSS
jgi:hypothetical protein